MNRSKQRIYSGWVFKLILVNLIIFVSQIFTVQYKAIYSVSGLSSQTSVMSYYFGLIPGLIVEKGYLWQIFSYMFLHGTTNLAHIFFNMYALLIFGAPIENMWGSKRFLFYYFFCGIGAGLTILVINLISEGMGYYIPTIGASGAVFGLLLAFGVLFPNAKILIFFILPIKAKYLVILYGGLELYLELMGGYSNISHAGHLGGLFFGLLYFLILKKRALIFKSKTLLAKMEKSKRDYDTKLKTGVNLIDENNNDFKKNILNKLQQSGYEALTDDEIQYLKYLDIMSENDDNLCKEEDLNINDDYCNNCEKLNACLLREFRKYIN